ncbi:MAG TPA: hypothetical protein PKW55_02345 [Spirochaetota bacterium]|mgnify:CR=1 FL=1|nr:hypothetical protein [Spirochaetota bacterium]HOM38312.1 hypothetical protein [Spirochaetota bacterium]HPQ48470.1 hypothetical protein [Spirochaetota bacterium]
MKIRIKYFLYLFLFFILIIGCGISEHSIPSVLEKGDSFFQYSISAIQTNPDYQIGDEFIPSVGVKASWGIGYNTEIGIKTFGLGLGPEIKYEFFKYKSFVSSIAYELNFSFPIMGDIMTELIPVNKDFLNFISKPFYFSGVKLISGFELDTWIFSILFKIGYLGNIGFLPDISTSDSSYPGFWYQFSISSLSREKKTTMLGIGLEIGVLYPKKLTYLSFVYKF